MSEGPDGIRVMTVAHREHHALNRVSGGRVNRLRVPAFGPLFFGNRFKQRECLIDGRGQGETSRALDVVRPGVARRCPQGGNEHDVQRDLPVHSGS